MSFKRILVAPLLAAALLVATGSLDSVPVVSATQKGQAAHPKKPATYRYICPMHADVKSKTPGKCPKCKMKLEKKRIKEPEAKPADQ